MLMVIVGDRPAEEGIAVQIGCLRVSTGVMLFVQRSDTIYGCSFCGTCKSITTNIYEDISKYHGRTT